MQKCLSCRATAHGLVQQGDRVCNNMNLRLGTKRTLAMGISGIAGWGLFAMEDIARGDFIVRCHSFCSGHIQLLKRDSTVLPSE